jgi:sulfate/thiosulfate transport system permease protein
MAARLGLRFAALGYLAALLIFPVGLVFWRTFQHGIGPVIDAATAPEALHALWLTIIIALIVVPANTVFGIVCALVIVRDNFRWKGVLNAVIDLPFALSPVVIGLALYLVYARTGWLGDWLVGHGINVIFALPGMILATIFVSLPFVVRETIPVLREVGIEQEEAAWTLGASPLSTFFRVTMPAIRWGVTYGIVLTTARAIGEFGAVSIVSGSIAGRTETLTLHVQNRFQSFDLTGAYTASVELALLALITLLLMTLLRKETPGGDSDSPGHEALR